MKIQNSKKMAWFICVLGWMVAIISFSFLPDIIPTNFSDGIPGNYSNRLSIFLWPIGQGIVILLGENKKMLPRQLEELITDTQYNWVIFGIVLFIFVIELLIVYVTFSYT